MKLNIEPLITASVIALLSLGAADSVQGADT